MNQGMNTTELLSQLKTYIRKGHYFVLFAFISAIVGMTILSVMGMLNTPANTQTTPTQTTRVDFSRDSTVQKIQKLEFSDDTNEVSLPTEQRINPFAE